jgi:hypothetical protein
MSIVAASTVDAAMRTLREVGSYRSRDPFEFDPESGERLREGIRAACRAPRGQGPHRVDRHGVRVGDHHRRAAAR